MKIETYIDSLVSYAMNNGLAEPVDHMVLTNRLMDLLRLDDYTPSDEPQSKLLDKFPSLLNDGVSSCTVFILFSYFLFCSNLTALSLCLPMISGA